MAPQSELHASSGGGGTPGPPPEIVGAYVQAFGFISVSYGAILLVVGLTMRADVHVYVGLVLLLASEAASGLVFWWHNRFAHERRVIDYLDGPRMVLRRSIWCSTAIVDAVVIAALLPSSLAGRLAIGLVAGVARLMWVGYAERYTQRSLANGSMHVRSWLWRLPRRACFASLAFTVLIASGCYGMAQRTQVQRFDDVRPAQSFEIAGLEGEQDRELRVPTLSAEEGRLGGEKEAEGAEPVPGRPGYTG